MTVVAEEPPTEGTIEATDVWKKCMSKKPPMGECGKIILSNQGLTGTIPEALGSIHNLQILDLSHNQLTGQIPASLGQMINAQKIDLSHNQPEGSIPAELSVNNGPRSQCQYLDVSHNKLSDATLPEANHWDQLQGNFFNDGQDP